MLETSLDDYYFSKFRDEENAQRKGENEPEREEERWNFLLFFLFLNEKNKNSMNDSD